jgi:SNF2 family DNA or RNA helicase
MGGKRDERERFIKQDLPLVNGKYQFDAVVTSYEGLLKEKTKLAKVPWKYIIIDEAHR